MKLYSSSNPDIAVCCDGKILKADFGRAPLCVAIQLSVILALLLSLFILFVTLWFRFTLWSMCGHNVDNGVMVLFFMEAFFLSGILLLGRCIMHLANKLLPYSVTMHISDRTLCSGNKLWHRSYQMKGKVVLLIDPCYTRGNWGFALKILSNRRQCLLLPGVFIGTYSKAISEARKLAENIQRFVPFMKIDESEYWRYH